MVRGFARLATECLCGCFLRSSKLQRPLFCLCFRMISNRLKRLKQTQELRPGAWVTLPTAAFVCLQELSPLPPSLLLLLNSSAAFGCQFSEISKLARSLAACRPHPSFLAPSAFSLRFFLISVSNSSVRSLDLTMLPCPQTDTGPHLVLLPPSIHLSNRHLR